MSNLAIGRLYCKALPIRGCSKLEAVTVVANVIIESAALYRKNFDGNFIVIAWPRFRQELSQEGWAKMELLLSKHEIEMLFPPELLSVKLAQIHERDPHPSSLEYEKMAKYIHAQLNK